MTDGLVVDLFAGGGGASKGIEQALGRPVDIAINHDPVALAVHRANHPHTQHVEEDVWKANPHELVQGRRVALLWASPDCTHFSTAKGGKPRKQKLRTLAWAVYRWARATLPDVIFLENVREFETWGPLTKDGFPDRRFMGKTFRCWVRRLERLGYVVEWRLLDASLYGAPTRRRRLFVVARRDGQPIVWPAVTHGLGGLPVRTAAECIDWSLPCPSIFERRRPLVDKTLWRIAQGVKRFVLEAPQPFIVGVGGRAGQSYPTGAAQPVGTITAKNDRALVVPTLMTRGWGEDTKRNGGRGQAARVPGLDKPLGTLMAQGQKHALVAAFLAKHFGGVVGHGVRQPIGAVTSRDHHALAAAHLVKLRGACHSSSVDSPMPTLSAQGTHVGEVRAFLTAYYGSDGGKGKGQPLSLPMRSLTARHRLGLVTVEGIDYQIIDIGMRMLEPHELLRAQFGRYADGYDLSRAVGKRGKWCKSEAVRLIGNSVCPEVAEALVAANRPIPILVAA